MASVTALVGIVLHVVAVVVIFVFSHVYVRRQGGPSPVPYYGEPQEEDTFRTHRVRKHILFLVAGIFCVFLSVGMIYTLSQHYGQDGYHLWSKEMIRTIVVTGIAFALLAFYRNFYIHDLRDRFVKRTAFGRTKTIVHANIDSYFFIRKPPTSPYLLISCSDGMSLYIKRGRYWAPHLYHGLAVFAAKNKTYQELYHEVQQLMGHFCVYLDDEDLDEDDGFYEDYLVYLRRLAHQTLPDNPDSHYSRWLERRTASIRNLLATDRVPDLDDTCEQREYLYELGQSAGVWIQNISYGENYEPPQSAVQHEKRWW
ncbi:MAG: hypothetical protein Q4P66_06705 [Actinomycetaceae bacterium]|nr:hypothetical protein [Actinomycetaceae bacterium]